MLPGSSRFTALMSPMISAVTAATELAIRFTSAALSAGFCSPPPHASQKAGASSRGNSSTTVTLEPAYHERLTAGRIPPAELVRRSFAFLLEREPKESILASFALPVIARYFPEYEREMKARLGG